MNPFGLLAQVGRFRVVTFTLKKKDYSLALRMQHGNQIEQYHTFPEIRLCIGANKRDKLLPFTNCHLSVSKNIIQKKGLGSSEFKY